MHPYWSRISFHICASYLVALSSGIYIVHATQLIGISKQRHDISQTFDTIGRNDAELLQFEEQTQA